MPVIDPGDVFITDDDVYLFNEGTHLDLGHVLGAHVCTMGGDAGTRFAVWAPSARTVSVIGDFNGWNPGGAPLTPRASSGIWQGFVPGIGAGEVYKYRIEGPDGYAVEKADPVAAQAEEPPRTGSVVWDGDYAWRDQEWMTGRAARNALGAPISIYEMHLGSWRRVPEQGDRSLTYREVAAPLVEHLDRLGFTHVEFLPLMEHPFYGSWGYQTTGFFAPTSRYGDPEDLMYLVDELHRAGFGVIFDWVPSHFPADQHGLSYFDGTHLFEHADPREGHHKDWDSLIFNYGRHEVRSFLLSSANWWIERFHADGLRVDAVASMLYRDYSREEGEWIPNEYGGRENLEAIGFLRQFNEAIYGRHPDVQTYAEESTAWPGVSKPTYMGGLGFGMKWDMGWMHDTLAYMGEEPVHRSYHHGQLTFRSVYAFNENFVLPLSHDEVVHGKGSLLGRMPGDEWQRFANLRLLYAYMFTTPGKKLLFMGGEIGQSAEWSHESSIDWHLLDHGFHRGVERFVSDAARLYRDNPALHVRDFDGGGFEWLDAGNALESVASYVRWGPGGEAAVVVLNLTPVPRSNHRLGVPFAGAWREVLNSDAVEYQGSGQGNLGSVEAVPIPAAGRDASLLLTLPPLGALVLVPDAE
ncbi:MAG: 1,4-alpha-glucan branching protein GlgB [Thermoleophilia bacterium]|nr:1,4-alpha-glucan branching protein GlgB [Thermoleophilia bacterium]